MRLDAAVPELRGGIFCIVHPRSRLVKFLSLLIAVVLVVAGCGSPNQGRLGACRRPRLARASGHHARPPRRSSRRPARPPTTVRLALDWTPNTNHTGFFVARREGLVSRRPGIDLQILPYASATPETLLAAHQAECGISFQDSMTFAVAAGADIVSVAAILQRTASAIGVLADGPITAAEGPRRQDVRRFRLPERGPDAEGGDQGGRRHRRVQGRDARRRRLRGALQAAGRLHDPVHRLGGRRGRPARDRRCATSSSPTPASPSSTRSSSPATASGSSGDPDAARRFVGRHGPRLRVRRRPARRGGRGPHRGEPRRVRREQASSRRPVSRFLDERRLPRRRPRRVRDPDSRALDRATPAFLYDQGLLVDSAGKPLPTALDYARLFTNDFLP